MSDPFKENKTGFSSFTARSKTKLPLLRTPWSSKRYTPYTRTPKTGRVSRIPTKNPPSSEQGVLRDTTNLTPVNKAKVLGKPTPNATIKKEKELTEINEDILSVVGKTWRINQCSPLYNFDYEKSSLQKYQKLLSAHLESDAAKGIAFEVDEDLKNSTFRAEFDVLKDFSFYDTDYTGLRIKVFSRKKQNTVKNANGMELRIPVLDAIFCYFGNEFEDKREVECFTSLPVCLVKGPMALAKCVFNWFEAQFDCRMIPMQFSPMDLSWYASLWAGIVPKGSKSELELCYSVPSSVKGLNRVIYSINALDAQKLWNCHHTNNSAIFTDEESSCFMKALESHFYRHFRVNLGALTLTRIGNPLVFIGCEGRIKISQAMYVRHILQQITASISEKEALGRL
ncbi:centromere protein L-like [Actinia tenebrosa]|uniref:Centromere protein L n=1 Tax=Actinia tenebrosa TaxID=6105 RepID=A0A6P8ITG4_ACTTE|nr:centromere protein L-like [Actinia tenebrosa]